MFLFYTPWKPKIFWCFLKVQNGNISQKWVQFDESIGSIVINFDVVHAFFISNAFFQLSLSVD